MYIGGCLICSVHVCNGWWVGADDPTDAKKVEKMGKMSTEDESTDTTLPNGNDGSGKRRERLANPHLLGKKLPIPLDGVGPPLLSNRVGEDLRKVAEAARAANPGRGYVEDKRPHKSRRW